MDRGYALFVKLAQFLEIMLYVLVAGVMWGTWLVTLSVEVPIDNKISGWSATTLPPDWQHIRARWAAFHTLRTFLSVGAVAAAVGAALTARVLPIRVTEQPTPARRVPT
jgi:dipeptide/tripeptide permease